MPPADLKTRIKTSPWVRGLLPARMLVKRAERRGQAMWEADNGKREWALSEMKTILAGTPRVEELHELARRYLIEHQIASYGVLFWQQRWSAKVDAQSQARLHAALSANRGVLLSACHIGPFYRLQYAPPLAARDTYFVAGSWFFEPAGPGAWGRQLARYRKGMKSCPLSADWSFPIIQGLLERGDPVIIHFDVSGTRETSFVGKPTMLTDGSAQLAFRTDALVLPLRARRVGHRVWADAGAPLDPREFADADTLHDALAAVHERWILEDPATVESAENWDLNPERPRDLAGP